MSDLIVEQENTGVLGLQGQGFSSENVYVRRMVKGYVELRIGKPGRGKTRVVILSAKAAERIAVALIRYSADANAAEGPKG